MFTSKDILNRFVTKVVKDDAVYPSSEEGKWGVDQTKAIDYTGDNYSEDMVLMYTPINWLRLEFEDTPEQNRNIISIIEAQAKSIGYDYCVTEHKGAKSPYFNMCDLPHPDDADDWKLFKNQIISQIVPDKFLAKLDRTNLGMTLSPIIGHPHWKPKYHKAKHEIVRGINPCEHKNKENQILKDILKKINASKKKVHKEISDIKGNCRWVEDFLLDYCCNNKLPSGQRHQVICKNLAILITFRNDRESIIDKFLKSQQMQYSDISGWINGVARGEYNKVSSGELKRYIYENELPYKIVEYNNPYDVNSNISDIIQDLNNPYINVQNLYKRVPFFFDKNEMYWFWNKESKNWELKDDTDVINIIGKAFKNQTSLTDSKIVNQYLRAIQLIGRENIPKEPKKTWVQFKDKVFDIQNKDEFESTPEYFFTNPLPYTPAQSSTCKKIDELLEQWNTKQKQTMYEIIAYCCLMDYPLHFIFLLNGCGSNGKSKFQKLLRRFFGEEKNCCSVDLDVLVENRFESSKLYRKLICLMGETNFGVINKTNRLKALSGQDMVGVEFKNKQPFDTVNYAKIVIASNSLPISEDTTDGFFRRWLIIDFPNQFPESQCPIDMLPDSEFAELSRRCIEILPGLLERSKFTNQGTIEERKKKYIMVSNPITEFFKNICEMEYNTYIRYSELYTAYIYYLDKLKKRVISKKAFSEALDREAILVEKTSKNYNNIWVSDRWVIGVRLKPNWKELCDFSATYDYSSTLFPYRELSVNKGTSSTKVTETVYLPCFICGTLDNCHYNNSSKPVCDSCDKAIQLNKAICKERVI